MFKSLLLTSVLAATAMARGMGPHGEVVVGYYDTWGGSPAAKDLAYDQLTHINIAFSTVQADFSPSVPVNTITELVPLAHKYNTKVLISVGGWGGCNYYSPMVNNVTGRAIFIKGVKNMIETYNLDGIDFDWEYPGEQGACGQPYAPTDTANFLVLLKQLRKAIGHHKLITAATFTKPFADVQGNPSTDLSEFAKVFDWINIMTYDLNDIWGTTTGVNSPLRDGQGFFPPNASIEKAVDDWHATGMPYSKMTVGVAFYGHYATSISSMANNTPSDVWVPVKGGNTEHACTGAGLGGTWNYIDIRNWFLDAKDFTKPKPGWIRKYDPKTQTPWLFNPSNNTFVTYDDPISVGVKVGYTKARRLKGLMFWEMGLDGGELLPVVGKILD